MNLEDKILDGYLYNISSDRATLHTGSGGAKEYIKLLRESGLSDELIGSMISVNTNQGKYTLNQLKVKDIEEKAEIISEPKIPPEENLYSKLKNGKYETMKKWTKEELIQTLGELFNRKAEDNDSST